MKPQSDIDFYRPLLQKMIFVFFLIGVPNTFLFAWVGAYQQVVVSVSILLSLLCVLLLMYIDPFFYIYKTGFISILSVSATYYSISMNNKIGSEFVLFSFLSFPFLFFNNKEKRYAIFCFLFIAVQLVFLKYFGSVFTSKISFSEIYNKVFFHSSLISAIGILYFCFDFYFNHILKFRNQSDIKRYAIWDNNDDFQWASSNKYESPYVNNLFNFLPKTSQTIPGFLVTKAHFPKKIQNRYFHNVFYDNGSSFMLCVYKIMGSDEENIIAIQCATLLKAYFKLGLTVSEMCYQLNCFMTNSFKYQRLKFFCLNISIIDNTVTYYNAGSQLFFLISHNKLKDFQPIQSPCLGERDIDSFQESTFDLVNNETILIFIEDFTDIVNQSQTIFLKDTVVQILDSMPNTRLLLKKNIFKKNIQRLWLKNKMFCNGITCLSVDKLQ